MSCTYNYTRQSFWGLENYYVSPVISHSLDNCKIVKDKQNVKIMDLNFNLHVLFSNNLALHLRNSALYIPIVL